MVRCILFPSLKGGNMEKTTVLKVGKYTSIFVMLLTGMITTITIATSYLESLDWGTVIIAFGVFLVSLRNYIKDTYGVF